MLREMKPKLPKYNVNLVAPSTTELAEYCSKFLRTLQDDDDIGMNNFFYLVLNLNYYSLFFRT